MTFAHNLMFRTLNAVTLQYAQLTLLKRMMLLEIGVHDVFHTGISCDGREQKGLFVVVVRVYHFVEALAVGEEVGDVGEEGELGVLEGDGVEGAEHEVVGEGHVGCDFEGFFGDLGVFVLVFDWVWRMSTYSICCNW